MKRLNGTDALFLSMETTSWHQHVAGMTVLDKSDAGDFTFEKAVENLEMRLPLAPKFTWKLKGVPFGLDRPVWIKDEDFQIERHVRRVAVPSPGGKRETADLLSQIIGYQLDRRIPMWEWWYLEGIQGDRVAMVLKFHHCLLDGMSGASLATVLMDIAPDAPPPQIPTEPLIDVGPEPTDLELLARSVIPNTRLPLKIARYGGQLMRRGAAMAGYQRENEGSELPTNTPRVRWNAKVGPRRSCAFESIALADVKALKEKYDVKVNDVVMALCAGAMMRYLEDRDEAPAEGSLVASCPVSTRAADDDELDNKIANMIVSLATDIDDPVERLQQIAQNSRHSKAMTEALRAKAIQSIGETAPPLVLNQAVSVLKRTGAINAMPTITTTVISNVPGPPIPLYYNGARATGIFPGSVILEAMGLNVTVLSYVDRIDFGFSCDPDLVPDLWDMAEAVPDVLGELLKAADLGVPTAVEDAFGDR